ncbi:MAG: UspA protein [Burkholderiaceae bacterium]|jgi:nucleotide-binding universal stress UspA family protein|nr:UspA protein [Burkholderiaceae bacterium]
MKILLPVDGSKYTKRMLSYIAAHDELLGSGHEYLLFTVVPRLTSRAAEFFDRRTLDGYYEAEAEKALRAARTFAEKQGWAVRSAHAAGHAAEEIAAYAKAQKPALIVMGTHGHSALGNAVLGSVAQGVLARCTVPMLLVH